MLGGQPVPLTSSFASQTAFLGLLEYLAKEDTLDDDRFPARNWLLECEIPNNRVIKYLASPPSSSAVGVDPKQALNDLTTFHKAYLNAEIHIGARTNPFSSTTCPDTFRVGHHIKEYRCPNDDEFLVRLEQLDFLAERAQLDPPLDDVYGLLERVAEANQGGTALSDDDHNDCAELLGAWQRNSDNRPFYATFWGHAAGALFRSNTTWPDELRNRLGLVHYNPDAYPDHAKPIRVALFRYRIARVPESDRPLLVRPTVLDGSINNALYTNAPRSGVGWAVDLTAGHTDLWREVVHPAITFEVGDVWAVGEISDPLSTPVAEARDRHSRWLIAAGPGSQFAQLCGAIDCDLP